MKFTLTLSTDNAAFQDDNLGFEVANILRGAANKIASEGLSENDIIRLRDSNGNRVGFAVLEESE